MSDKIINDLTGIRGENAILLNDVALLSGKIAINHGHSGNIHCYVCILCVSGIIELQINGIHVVLEDRSGITLKYAVNFPFLGQPGIRLLI